MAFTTPNHSIPFFPLHLSFTHISCIPCTLPFLQKDTSAPSLANVLLASTTPSLFHAPISLCWSSAHTASIGPLCSDHTDTQG